MDCKRIYCCGTESSSTGTCWVALVWFGGLQSAINMVIVVTSLKEPVTNCLAHSYPSDFQTVPIAIGDTGTVCPTRVQEDTVVWIVEGLNSFNQLQEGMMECIGMSDLLGGATLGSLLSTSLEGCNLGSENIAHLPRVVVTVEDEDGNGNVRINRWSEDALPSVRLIGVLTAVGIDSTGAVLHVVNVLHFCRVDRLAV